MKMTRKPINLLLIFGTVLICLLPAGRVADAQLPSARPLFTNDFQFNAPRGFGDRNNSWAQSMVWWHNALYVGTSRQSLCASLYAVYQYAGITISPQFAATYLAYPPADPDLSCPLDGADLALQAEIWRYTPQTDWQRTFQSPNDLDNPGPGAPYPARPGKKVPYEISIRDLEPFTEPDGTEALYAFGVNSTLIWDRTKLPPPRILRTTDGMNWTPVPQTPGTFLGDLPFNPDHSSFRAAATYNGKMFALAGPAFGQGSLIASANPSQGNNAWYLAANASILFYELKVFNGWLYLGGFDPTGGYAVYKTKADGQPPYQLTTVVPSGAGLTVRPSKSVVSMHVFNNRLYVGTATFTEVIRINADDTWELVVGSPRTVTTASGTETKYPISGLDAGWGHTLNDHAWQMDDRHGYLYTGTYNASTASRLDPVNGPLLTHNMGGHMYRSPDGWYQSPVTTSGFSNLGDPKGGKFDFGIRSMVDTPLGNFVGTANDYYGLTVLLALPHASLAPDPPYRLEIEQQRTGGVLLSWGISQGATLYRVWRAEVNPIYIRDDVNFENWNGISGNKIPDQYVGPYTQIAVLNDTAYVDRTTVAGKKYMYYVTSNNTSTLSSDPSNLVAFPLLRPPVTFAGLLSQNAQWTTRGRFTNAAGATKVATTLQTALASAAACQLTTAMTQLNPRVTPLYLQSPDSVDAEVLLSKMVRRLQLFQRFPQEVVESELCTATPR